MRKVIRDNGLSIVLLTLFVLFWLGQSVAGYREHSAEQLDHGSPPQSYSTYLRSAHFWEATAENWESEFLQIFCYVMLTAMLFQRGSAESKDPDKPEPVDRDPRPSQGNPNAPWPVRRGGVALKIYEHSLSLSFFALFLVSISLHALAGAAVYNEEQAEHGAVPGPVVPAVRRRPRGSGSSRSRTGRASSWRSRLSSSCRSFSVSAAHPSPNR